MGQVSGADATFNFYKADTFGQPPAVPNAIKLYLASMGIKGTRGQTASKILPMGTGNRTEKAPVRNKLEVGGGMATELNGQTLGFLLLEAMGAVAVYRPAAVSGTQLVTGVTIDHATKACPVGNGTLTFTLTGTTLAWTANGDTIGAAQDVSAGGSFTLASGTAGSDLTVTVVAGSLPGADQADTIAVVSAYKNRFSFAKIGEGFSMEKDHGPEIAGVGRYVLYDGCKVNTMSFSLGTEGVSDVSVDILAANKTPGAAPLDATATDYGHTSFGVADIALVEEAGASLAVGTDVKININNNLDGGQYTLLSGGKRRSIPEGAASVGVEYTALFEDLALYNKMLNGTSSSLRAKYALGDGLGTAGNEAIQFDLNPISYEEDDTAIEGPGGMVINPKAIAYDGALVIDLYNAIDHSL